MNATKGCFYGIKGIFFIWHGPYSDPEVEYRGIRFNYWDLEEELWNTYKDEMKSKGSSIDTVCPSTHETFADWVLQHEEIAKDILDDQMMCLWEHYTDSIPEKDLSQIEALYAAIMEDYHAS